MQLIRTDVTSKLNDFQICIGSRLYTQNDAKSSYLKELNAKFDQLFLPILGSTFSKGYEDPITNDMMPPSLLK
ncbi:hypothetical protein MED121_09153 [Marinomonas sp. MED121]|nr:hypothetical protein MED121_09153 [Marinomonas sp. MED121]